MTPHSSILAWRISWAEGAWQTTVRRVSKSWIRLDRLNTHGPPIVASAFTLVNTLWQGG